MGMSILSVAARKSPTTPAEIGIAFVACSLVHLRGRTPTDTLASVEPVKPLSQLVGGGTMRGKSNHDSDYSVGRSSRTEDINAFRKPN